jgi:CheY-like chemotaxis protein
MIRTVPNSILVVEDDPDVMFSVTSILELEGYTVLSANNGLEGLEVIKNAGIPQLILLDMKMPVMDGWRFCEAFKALHNHEASIVVMTAAADAHSRAKDIGADDTLAKPFKIDELLAIAKKYVRA